MMLHIFFALLHQLFFFVAEYRVRNDLHKLLSIFDGNIFNDAVEKVGSIEAVIHLWWRLDFILEALMKIDE